MPDREPTFSIVVPLYNTERYIAEALDSIEAQTFDDFEVIVINDASTDNGPAIVQRYIARDDRFRMITQENRGLAGARNSGIRAARGKYIALLDADDVWLPEKLQRHFDHIENNADVGISYAPSIFIDDHSQRMRAMQSPQLDNITPEHMFCRNPVAMVRLPSYVAPCLMRSASTSTLPRGVGHAGLMRTFGSPKTSRCGRVA